MGRDGAGDRRGPADTDVIPVKRHFAYILALLVEVAAFYRHVLIQRGYLFPWDFRGVHLPLATFVAASMRRGEMPLWEPYTYCGNPIFANIQAARSEERRVGKEWRSRW